MSRSRRFLGGLFLSYGYQGMLMLAGLVLTPFYLRRIGQHDYGLWLVGTQLLTYLSLTDFGVVALLPLETAYATGRAGSADNARDLPDIVGQTARLVLYQLPFVIAVALAMWFAIPAEWQGLRGPLALVLLGFVIAFPLRIFPALLQGLQDLSFVNGLQIINWLVSTAVAVSGVLAGWSLYSLAAGWLLSQTFLAPVYFFRLRRRFPGVLPDRLPSFDWGSSRKQLGKGFWINVAQIAELLMSNTDMLIIGKVLGPAAVVPYACTGKLVSVLANQANILMHNAAPGLCEVKTGETREHTFSVLTALTHGVLAFSGLVCCVVLVVNHWFVNWWVTAGQYGGFALTVAIVVNVLFGHWKAMTAYTVFCFGHQRRLSLTNLTNGLVTVGASIGLTVILGPIGAPIGALVGAMSVSLPLNLSKIAEDTGTSMVQLIGAMLGGLWWRLMLVGAATLAVALRWSPQNLAQASAAAVGVSAVYLAVVFPIVMDSPLGNYVRPYLTSFRAKYAVEAKAS